MAELPILPLNTAALLADTQHMTAEQFGGYCRLLFTMWQHGGQLVDNDDELARITKISRTKLKQQREVILRPMTIAGGVISQKRLTATYLNVQETRRRRAAAGQKRWSRAGHKPG